MDNQPHYNPVQPPQQRPTFQPDGQPVESVPPAIPRPPKKKKLLPILLIVASLLALVGVGASLYFWQQSEAHKAEAATLSTEVKGLNERIDTLSTEAEPVEQEPQTQGNIITIRELGVSITVPDSLADLTYTYTTDAEGSEDMVYFSTKALSRIGAEEGQCFAANGPMGMLGKRKGAPVQEMDKAITVLEGEEFYYISRGPQALCAETAEARALLATVTELSGAIKESLKELE